MKKKIWVIGALLLGLGIIAYFAASENEAVGSGEDDGVADSRPDSHFEPRSSVKDKKKKDRAVMLNKALKVMKLQQEQQQQAHGAKELNEEPSDANHGTMADKFNEGAEKHDLETLEAELERGARDEQWSAEVAAHLEDLFDKMKPTGTSVGSVDCTATMCGVTLRHKDHAAFQEFGASKDFAGPWDKGERFGTFSMMKDNLSIRFFFSKEGERLP